MTTEHTRTPTNDAQDARKRIARINRHLSRLETASERLKQSGDGSRGAGSFEVLLEERNHAAACGVAQATLESHERQRHRIDRTLEDIQAELEALEEAVAELERVADTFEALREVDA